MANSAKQTTREEASKIRWGDSYVGLLLGIIVVVVAAIIFAIYLQIRQTQQTINLRKEVSSTHTTMMPSLTVHPLKEEITDATEMPSISSAPTVTIEPEKEKIAEKPIQKGEYIVGSNDSLWSIAEAQLGDGYRWVEIAKLNNLESNPGIIFKGMKIIIPQKNTTIAAKSGNSNVSNNNNQQVEQQNTSNIVAIKTDTYTVQSGDTLWDIANRAYGDPYKYTEIAQINNLANPSIIHAGNVFKIPRNNNP